MHASSQLTLKARDMRSMSKCISRISARSASASCCVIRVEAVVPVPASAPLFVLAPPAP